MDAPLAGSPRLPWPAILASAALAMLTLMAIGQGLRMDDGVLTYTVDDPYIHMTIARNLAFHGTWGVNPGTFDPASSSPLWTLLLAAIDRLVVSDWTPLALNLVFSIVTVFVLERLLRPYLVGGALRGAVVLAIALAIPLPAASSTGMEAPVHVPLALLLAWTVARRLAEPGPAPPGNALVTGALAMLCELLRPESMFLIGVLGLIALGRRRPAIAWALAAGVALAAGGYLAFTLPRGGLGMPNSVLLKAPTSELAGPSDWGRFLFHVPYKLFVRRHSHMTALLVAAGWLLLPRPQVPAGRALVPRLLLMAFIPSALLHVQFADLGWFYRYEAYLMAIGLSAIAAALARGLYVLPAPFPARGLPWPARAFAILMALLLAFPIFRRTVRSAREIAPAMRNIYEQQYQMARFVRDQFRGREVAVNDLGAVSYYGGARVVDLLGLASMPIARQRLAHHLDTDFIERFCADRGVEVVIVYESFFVDATRPPTSWRPIATWTIPDRVTVADTVVTIFATSPAVAPRVRAAARAFAPELPRRVRVAWLE